MIDDRQPSRRHPGLAPSIDLHLATCRVSSVCVLDHDNPAAFDPAIFRRLHHPARAAIAVFLMTAFVLVAANWRAAPTFDICTDGR
jgi:hypothetical protein